MTLRDEVLKMFERWVGEEEVESVFYTQKTRPAPPTLDDEGRPWKEEIPVYQEARIPLKDGSSVVVRRYP